MTAATVLSWDASDRSGTAVRDDGQRLAFDGAALDPRVRLLRPGQRLHVDLDGGTVVGVDLAGLRR